MKCNIKHSLLFAQSLVTTVYSTLQYYKYIYLYYYCSVVLTVVISDRGCLGENHPTRGPKVCLCLVLSNAQSLVTTVNTTLQ